MTFRRSGSPLVFSTSMKTARRAGGGDATATGGLTARVLCLAAWRWTGFAGVFVVAVRFFAVAGFWGDGFFAI
jgi:hypothetical protein